MAINDARYWNETYERELRQSRIREHPAAWEFVLSMIGSLQPRSHFIDFGCGTGEFVRWLAARTKINLTGLDHSHVAIEYARDQPISQVRWPSISYHVAGVYESGLPDRQADVVYSGHLLEHLEDPVDALLEQARVMKIRGTLFVHFPYRDEPYIEHLHVLDEAVVTGWLNEAGLEVRGQSEVFEGQPTNDMVIWAMRR